MNKARKRLQVLNELIEQQKEILVQEDNQTQENEIKKIRLTNSTLKQINKLLVFEQTAMDMISKKDSLIKIRMKIEKSLQDNQSKINNINKLIEKDNSEINRKKLQNLKIHKSNLSHKHKAINYKIDRLETVEQQYISLNNCNQKQINLFRRYLEQIKHIVE